MKDRLVVVVMLAMLGTIAWQGYRYAEVREELGKYEMLFAIAFQHKEAM